MKIQLGSVYTNKTKKYLLPCLIEYGEKFEEKFTNLFKLAIGIGDCTLIDMGIVIEHSIFILIDTKFSRKGFKDIIGWMKSQNYYKFDYPFDDLHTGHLHMLVIKIPEKYELTSQEFIYGNYSKMYELKDLNELFSDRKKELDVFNKDSQMLVTFIDKINEMFKTNVSYEGWEGEIELPLTDEEEYFNMKLFKTYKNENKRSI
jgi:hypothetical protein